MSAIQSAKSPCNRVSFVAHEDAGFDLIERELKDRTRVNSVNFTSSILQARMPAERLRGAQIHRQALGITKALRLPPPPPAHKAFAARSPASAPQATATKVLNVAVLPPGGSVLRALRGTSTVDSTTNTATDTGVAESAESTSWGGLVTADVGRAVLLHKPLPSTRLSVQRGRLSRTSSVNGTQVNNVNDRIPR